MEQTIKIKCPHCGWIRKVDVQAIEDSGATSIVQGPIDELRKVAESIRSFLTSNALSEANAWIDMPACPNCQNTYLYNVKTREVKK
jgi:hypothetical protein